jgi:cell division protein FtsL
VARRKRTKSKTKRISFKPGTSKRKKKQKVVRQRPSFTGILKVFAVVSVLAAIGIIAFAAVRIGSFLDKYVRKAVHISEKIGSLELVDVPAWVNDQLKEKIYAAARADGEDLKLDEDVARSVQNNLEREVAWLKNVTVQTTHDTICIEAQWRRPIALVKRGLHKFYVDAELVVLDFVPVPSLPIVEVKDLSLIRKVPPTGKVWQRDDLAAAVDVLKLLWWMDEEVAPDKPLLWEIEVIDVSNFEGREDTRFPHIVLYAKDNTEIIWGAEIGTWQRYLEATDEEKLAKLYSYYKEHGSLLGVKYINLRDPQDNIPRPIDKY